MADPVVEPVDRGPERSFERDDSTEEHHNGQAARGESDPLPDEAPAPGGTTRDRRLTRGVIRRIDPWSVLKLSVVFYVTLYCILLVAAVLLWTAATTTGLRENVESFVADLIASGQFHFVAGELLRAGAVGGAILVVLGTGANVMLAVLYNLISDMVGGLSVVVEERGAGKRAPQRSPVADPELPGLLVPEAELRQQQRRRPRRAEPSGL